MGRVSQAVAATHREQILLVATRLFRERGTQVAINEIMAHVGLTHGSFYRHFPTKESLVAEVMDRELNDVFQRLRSLNDAPIDDADFPAGWRPRGKTGWPSVMGAAGVRDSYLRGISDLASMLAETPTVAETPSGAETTADKLLADGNLELLCGALGAAILARANEGTAMSDHLVHVARTMLVRLVNDRTTS